MFRNLTAQQIRQTAFQNAVAGFRAQQAAQPQWGTPPIGAAAPPRRPGVMYLTATYYSIPGGTNDSSWSSDTHGGTTTTKRTDKASHFAANQYDYARNETGQDPQGLDFQGLNTLFGDYHVKVTVDGTGDVAHYIGNNAHLTAADAASLNKNGFKMVTPNGVVDVEPYLLANAGSADPSTIAGAIATTTARSASERATSGLHDQCNPWGDITRTQAQALISTGHGFGCVNEIAKYTGTPGGGGGGVSTPSTCSTGYRKYMAIPGGSPCPAGQTWEKDPANATCGRCVGAACPDGYSSTQPSCGPGYRLEPHPTSPGCWACNPGCPGGGYVPPDQATCPAAQQQPDTTYNTGCVKCAPACPAGYYMLPAGAPFTCPPWQQRKVDEASGCVACETAANCFPTASGLACGAGQTPQIYGDFTCCQAAPTSPPPSDAPPSNAPATTPTTAPPGAIQAGIGLGGGIALAVVAIIAGKLFFGGKGGATPEPRTSARPRSMAEFRERLYR